MNTVELLQYSLKNALDIMDGVTADLTQEMADWQPPGTAMSIGALYWHMISGTDHVVHSWGLDQPPLSQSAGWEEKVARSSEPVAEGGHAGRLREVCIDLPAMHDYSKAVSDALQSWLASLTPQDLERKIETPLGELNLGQMLETFVVWHVSAHAGEISALKGCQGGKGYPF